MLRLPAARLAALRFLRLAIPHRFVDEGLSNPVTPDSGCVETTGSPTFLGKPRLSLCTCSSDPGGTDTSDHNEVPTRPPLSARRRLPTTIFTFGAQYHGFKTRCLRLAEFVTSPSARLASRCWLDSPVRAFHPKGFRQKVSKRILTSLPPFPSIDDNWYVSPFVARALPN